MYFGHYLSTRWGGLIYRHSQCALDTTFQRDEVVSFTAIVSVLWTLRFNEMRWSHLPPWSVCFGHYVSTRWGSLIYRHSQCTLDTTFQRDEVVSFTAIVSVLWTLPSSKMCCLTPRYSQYTFETTLRMQKLRSPLGRIQIKDTSLNSILTSRPSPLGDTIKRSSSEWTLMPKDHIMRVKDPIAHVKVRWIM